MERSKIVEQLMTAKKSNVVDLCATLLDLLQLNLPGESSYTQGWNDSRNSILSVVEVEMQNANLI